MAPDPPKKSGLSRFLDFMMGWTGSLQTSKSVRINIQKNVRVVRIINGKREVVDSNLPNLQGLLGEDVLSEIASQLGMS